jgi:hypothetical protein
MENYPQYYLLSLNKNGGHIFCGGKEGSVRGWVELEGLSKKMILWAFSAK